uniref:Histone chaperone domain-containing protein n=1 Tax=Amphiprion ocellaris TaxID=80972 RepID=A0AAQ5WYZ6_AMPOC
MFVGVLKNPKVDYASTSSFTLINVTFVLGCESLSPEARNFMKQVVQEELLKMQVFDFSHITYTILYVQFMISFKHFWCCRSEQSDDEEQSQSDDAEQEMEKSQPKTNGKRKRQINSDDSLDEEEDTKSGKKGGDSPKEMMKKKENTTKNGKTRSSKTSEEKKTPQSDEENDTDSDSKSERSDKIDDNDKGDHTNFQKQVLKCESMCILGNCRGEILNKYCLTFSVCAFILQTNNRAVVRLKRYISLCGVRRNYKKLLDGCRSIHSMVAVLKKELEDLGVHGQPSVEKCKKVRMNREEAQEIAELDINNIITTQGRPKRRQPWQQHQDPPSSVYQRSLNSGSDSDLEQNTHRKVTEWANLRGIISDDADSD